MNIICLAVVSDNFLFRQSLSDSINRDTSVRVVINVSNYFDLIQVIHKVGLVPDICILDLDMFMGKCFDIIRQLNVSFPSVKTIILSLYLTELAIFMAKKLGVNGFIAKEISIEALIKTIKSIDEGVDFKHSKLIGRTSNVRKISEMEIAFLKFCMTELSYFQIAQEMNKSVHTVESYRNSLFKKLNVSTRTALALYAFQSGL